MSESSDGDNRDGDYLYYFLFFHLFSEFKGKIPFVGIIQIRKPHLLVLEPELVKTVMIRNFKNFHDNEFGEMVP